MCIRDRNYVLQQFRATGCGDAALNGSAVPGYPDQALADSLAPRFPRFMLRLAH